MACPKSLARAFTSAILLFLGLALPSVMPAPTASAAPVVTLKAGDEIADLGKVAGIDVPLGICSIAAVGYDRRGNKVALSAGHCSEPGAVVGKNGLKKLVTQAKIAQRIGVVASRINTVTNKGNQDDKVDLLFIKLDRNVRIIPSGVGLGSPETMVGKMATKLGNGWFSPTVARGRVLKVSYNDIVAAVTTWPGDSGGRLSDARGRLIGIGSRVTGGSYGQGNTVFMRADRAIEQVTRRGLVGAGFRPI